ncbi:MAG: beta-exotoxin transport system ATP-binding protein [Thermoplasmata archaeon]|nr:beta-exotoxin transport system ATP-binding protein [Thermoplasmata archaeon]
MDPAIQTRALTKRYGKSRGIEGVDLEVRRGEVFGLLGPNGAGKTTTLRLLLDFLRPTSGEARVLGLDPRADGPALRAKVGYLPGEPGLAERSSARVQLRDLADLRGGVPEARIEALAASLELDLDREVRALSRGNKQKVGLVQAFMHEPELLILDEPTSGLDPLMQQRFNALVREAAARGATVFLSSHILPEVEALCDRVGIIREGKLAAVDTMASVRARAVRRVEARYRGAADAALARDVPGVEDLAVEGDTLRCAVRGEAGPLVQALARGPLRDLRVREPTLEDVFMGFYR